MSAQVRFDFGPCPKCGEPDPDANWRSASGRGVADGGWPRSCSDMKGVEHFHLDCRRCHFRWTDARPFDDDPFKRERRE